MATQQPSIKLRIDVDYPYPSRNKSFLAVRLRCKSKTSRDYLKNARTVARMINESPKDVKAYWFFTPYTIPDKRLLDLLKPERHEVALHIATEPLQEWKVLENETNRTVTYYTIHGTSSLVARLLWGRYRKRVPEIPSDFPLKSFHDFTTFGLDAIRYSAGFDGGKTQVDAWIRQSFVLSVHPEWLFQAGGRRGPYYDLLKAVLEVDWELDNLSVHKRLGVKVAHDTKEYERDQNINECFLGKLDERDIDV